MSKQSLSLTQKYDLYRNRNKEKDGIEKITIIGRKDFSEEDMWEAIKEYPNLKEIKIEEFHSISIVPLISEFKKLESIRLDDIHTLNIDYSLFKSLDHFNELIFYNIKNYQYKNEDCISNLKSLEVMRCNFLPFSKSSAVWGNLEKLDICRCELEFTEMLPSVKNIKEIRLVNLKNYEHLRHLEILEHLKVLSLDTDETIPFPSLKKFKHLEKVKVLQLDRNSLDEIFQSKTLKTLEVSNSSLSEFPTDIGFHPTIESVKFNFTPFDNYDYLKAFPEITSLRFNVRDGIEEKKGALTNELLASLRAVKKLEFNASLIAQDSIIPSLIIPNNIEELTIHPDYRLKEINLIFEENAELTSFQFSGYKEGFKADFSPCYKLETVNILGSNITKETLESLPAQIKNLMLKRRGDSGEEFSIKQVTGLETLKVESSAKLIFDFKSNKSLREVNIEVGEVDCTFMKVNQLESFSMKVRNGNYSSTIDKAFFQSPRLKKVILDYTFGEFNGFTSQLVFDESEAIAPLEEIELNIDKGFKLEGAFEKLRSIRLKCHESVDTYPLFLTKVDVLKSISIENGKPYSEVTSQITEIPTLDNTLYTNLETYSICGKSLKVPSAFFQLPSIERLSFSATDLVEFEEITTTSTVRSLSSHSDKIIINGGFEHLEKVISCNFSKKIVDEESNQLNISGLGQLVYFPASSHSDLHHHKDKIVPFIEQVKALATNYKVKEELFNAGYIALKNSKCKGIISLEACISALFIKGTLLKASLIDSLAYHSQKGEASLNKDSQLVLMGKFDFPQKEIIEAFKKIGISAGAKINEKTTHIALGKNVKTKMKGFDLTKTFDYQIINATKAHEVVLGQQDQYLVEDEKNDGVLTESIQELLATGTDENLLLVISLIENGGVPASLQDDLVYRLKVSNNTSIKKNLKKVLLTALPDKYQVIINDRQSLSTIHKLTESKTSFLFHDLVRKWGEDFTLYAAFRFFKEHQRGYFFLLTYTKPYDERRKPIMEHFVYSNKVHWQQVKVKTDRHFEFPQDLPYFTKVTRLEAKNCYFKDGTTEMMKEVKDVEYLDLSNSSLKSFEFDPTPVKSLKQIDLSENYLEEFPKDLMKVTTLEKVNLKKNSFSEIPDEVKKALPNCKIMI
ncbi:leucine-rich repeat domain-containing protein [Flammeovirga aprica]|uniref:Leucine-rich repeat domain-containing protein n=1 Tax=Flammeovirga aprica JL-4 TaxID=694437 RepID=A0A7X9P2D4_9BACT|nr:hypothetical protein [Flammeovirga aprica]NME68045.1 hypothetical protein [Flammeovirga aprica JL-4]